jgi:hypothetical protein
LIEHLPEHRITVVAQVADVSSEVTCWLEKVKGKNNVHWLKHKKFNPFVNVTRSNYEVLVVLDVC